MLDQLRFRRRISWLPASHSDRSLLPLYRKRIAFWLALYIYIHLYFIRRSYRNARMRRMIHVSRSLSHSLCSRKKSAVRCLLRYLGRVERVNVNGGHHRPFSSSLRYSRLRTLFDLRPARTASYRYPRHERATPLRRGGGGVSNFVNVTYEEKRKRMCENSPLSN